MLFNKVWPKMQNENIVWTADIWTTPVFPVSLSDWLKIGDLSQVDWDCGPTCPQLRPMRRPIKYFKQNTRRLPTCTSWICSTPSWSFLGPSGAALDQWHHTLMTWATTRKQIDVAGKPKTHHFPLRVFVGDNQVSQGPSKIWPQQWGKKEPQSAVIMYFLNSV